MEMSHVFISDTRNVILFEKYFKINFLLVSQLLASIILAHEVHDPRDHSL